MAASVVPVILAELEVCHSRPIAPTRRIALGERELPVDPPTGFGGILLAGVVATFSGALDDDVIDDLDRLLRHIELGQRLAQPRLRHRFQVDHIGLAKSKHRLLGLGDEVDFSLETEGSPESQILGAAYAAGQIDRAHRPAVMEVLRRAMRWRGEIGPSLVSHLSGASGVRSRSVGAFAHPELWALTVLGFDDGAVPGKREVQRRFRHLVRDAQLWSPWWRQDAAHRLPTAPSDPERLHRLAVEALKGGDAYAATVTAAIRHDSASRLVQVTVPTLVCADVRMVGRSQRPLAPPAGGQVVELDETAGRGAAWAVRQGLVQLVGRRR